MIAENRKLTKALNGKHMDESKEEEEDFEKIDRDMIKAQKKKN